MPSPADSQWEADDQGSIHRPARRLTAAGEAALTAEATRLQAAARVVHTRRPAAAVKARPA